VEEVRLSLFLEIEKGRRPSARTVGFALGHFAAAILEIGGHIDPKLALTVDFISDTEGSIHINLDIKVENNEGSDKNRAKRKIISVVIAICMLFGEGFVEETGKEVAKTLFGDGHPATQHQVPEDRHIGAHAAEAAHHGRHHIARMYDTLHHDKCVRGVGVTAKPHQAPKHLVPRDEFEKRASEAH
jgi:hypothetical protein